MAFWNWLAGGGGSAEVPYEPLDLDEVHARARKLEPAIATVDPEQRLSELQARLELEPSDGPTLAAVAACQLALGRYEEGVETLDMAIIHCAGHAVQCALAYRLKGTVLDMFLDEPDKAAQQYATSATLDGHSPALAIFRGELALRNGRKRELQKLLEAVLKKDVAGPLGDAEAALHAEDDESAVESLQIYHHISLLELVAAVG